MIYLILGLYLFFLSYKYDYREQKFYYKFHVRFSIFLLIIVAGFRYRMAPDSITYMGDFIYRTVNLWNLSIDNFTNTRYQPFWILLNSICKTIWDDFVFLQLVSAVIINCSISYFFKKSSKKYFTCLLFYYISCYVYFNMEIIREAIAVGMFMIAIVKYNEGNYKKCFLFFSFAVLFHVYAITVGIVFVFFSKQVHQTFKNLIAFLVVSIILVLPDPLKLAIELFGGDVGLSLGQYYDVKLESMSVLGYLFMILRVAVVYFAIRYFKFINVIPFTKLSKTVIQNIGILFIVLVVIRSVSIPFLERILNYFTLIIVVLLTSYFFNLLISKKYNRQRFSIYCIVIVAVICVNIIPMLKFIPEWRAPYYKRYFPYDSVFEKNRDPEREYIIRYEAKEY